MNEPETRAKDIKRTIISPLNFHMTMDSENLLQPPSSLPGNLLPPFDYFTMEELESWDFGTGSSLHDVTVCMGQVLYEEEYQHRHEHHDDSENRAPSSGPIRSQRRRGPRRAEAHNSDQSLLLHYQKRSQIVSLASIRVIPRSMPTTAQGMQRYEELRREN